MCILDLIVKSQKFSLVKFFPIKARISNHSHSHTETSQLIFTANKFTGFSIKDQCKKYQYFLVSKISTVRRNFCK